MFKWLTDLLKPSFRDEDKLPTPIPPKPHGEKLPLFLVQSASGCIPSDDFPQFSNNPYSEMKKYKDAHKLLSVELVNICNDYHKLNREKGDIEYKLRIARAVNRHVTDELDRLKSKRLAALERKIPSGYKLVKE